MRPSQLKFQLSWLISDDEHSHDCRLAAYRAFFTKQVPLLDADASFVLSEVYRKPVKSLYEEAICQVDCTIEWPATRWFNLTAKYQQVGRAWCDAGKEARQDGKALFQWLMPSPIEAFPLATHPVDRDVNLLPVSFGTLGQLDTFIEHQIFSARLTKDHRDYQISATLQRDQRSLHIDLHLNHRNACPDRVAECRFVVPHVNILKVLISEKTRFVELFVHLKIPVMLMGEVVSDYFVKPGSVASAFRWERYLTLGCPCIGGCVHGSSLCGGLIIKLAVSLDPRHLSLPCDPAYHEPHQDIIERDPVRIQIANSAMHQKLRDNPDEVRQLLMRWSGVQDVQIPCQAESDDCYIVVTSTGRDWQIWFLEELLLQ